MLPFKNVDKSSSTIYIYYPHICGNLPYILYIYVIFQYPIGLYREYNEYNVNISHSSDSSNTEEFILVFELCDEDMNI